MSDTGTAFHLLRQGPHDALKHQERHCIRGERSQKARQEPAPVSLRAVFPVNRRRGVPPPGESPHTIADAASQIIRHDSLLDDITRVTCQPEHLGTQPARPEIDGRCAHVGVVLHPPAKHVVRAPPEEEEAAEQHGRSQAMIHALDAVMLVHLLQTINRALVHPLLLARRVLDLQSCFHVLHGRRDEADRHAGQDAGQTVAVRGQGFGRVVQRVPGRVEQVVAQQPAVDCQRTEHDAVHEHPADQGRGGTLVKAEDALIADCLRDALERAGEAGGVGGLETNFDGVEGVANCGREKGRVSTGASSILHWERKRRSER